MNENIGSDSVEVDNSRVLRAFGQEAHVLISSEQTRDAFCVLQFFAPPGNVTPPHVHPPTDETFVIESGEEEINRGGRCSVCERATSSIFQKEFLMRQG